MPKYRKKPVVIEAIQYRDEMRKNDNLPEGVCIVPTDEGDMPIIHTLEGNMKVLDGDYIIKGVNGEIYPCKPDIFKKTYEKVK